MKVSASRINGFIRRPDPDVAAVLLFGPDCGLVRERADSLARSVVDDLNDPFRVVELTGAAIKSDPARLVDEAAQLSMTGGRRVVRVRDATDGVAQAFASLLDAGRSGNLVVAEAANLGKGSSLRKLFETAKNAAIIGCYEDGARELEGVIREILGGRGLVATADAMAFLINNLGGDRLVTRGELEKLVLYAGGDAPASGRPRPIELADAEACIGDSAAASLDAVAYAAAGGDAAALDRALERAFLEGESPVSVLRAVQRHLQRLHWTLGKVERGEPPQTAMKSLRPPLIFKFEPAFRTQLRQWRTDRLATALELATEAEIDCKSTGLPAAAVCHRALMRIAQAARASAHGR